MTNFKKIIIALLITVMALTACGVNNQVKETASADQSSSPVICTENTYIKKTNPTENISSENISSENAEETETPIIASSAQQTSTTPEAPSAQQTSTTPEAPREPLPPSEESQPTTPYEPDSPSETTSTAEQPHQSLSEMESEAVRLVNLEREKVGLAPLGIDNTYYSLVKLRADECVQFWSHTRPNGQKWSSVYPTDMTGVRKIGENLGKNFTTVADITEALMNSEGHRSAILNPDYTHICIAITLIKENEDPSKNLYAITQHFYQKED